VVYTFVCEIEAEDNRKMDKSTVIPFASRTAQDIIENLEKSLEILIVLKEGISSNSATLTTTTTPTNGGEGVKKFESLCRGIVSSVQVHFLLKIILLSKKFLKNRIEINIWYIILIIHRSQYEYD
jgi:hypothetical protein